MDPQWLLLLPLLWSHSEAEVVQSVSDCARFFLNGEPPEIPGVLENGTIQDPSQDKAICQTYENQPRFFTLYNTTNKIPVFSAYIFKGNESGRPKENWMTEPQVIMFLSLKSVILSSEDASYYQASDKDYKNRLGYDRGHLYPNSYGYSQTDKISTFTLTNTVPQVNTFNQGSWNKMESCVKCVMTKYCLDNNRQIEGFLVTGAEPSNNLLNNKINIPSKMWSAFCCYSSKVNKWLASAHWGNNVADEPRNKYMETKTLNELYNELRNASSFKLFSGNQSQIISLYLLLI
uniref:Endonuclease domain-containing 1 protein n=1 Tax=Neogobius melanostomus TaxID=47308 RepID=A0A8C6U524_9GOBI